jgi:hypothetical protein
LLGVGGEGELPGFGQLGGFGFAGAVTAGLEFVDTALLDVEPVTGYFLPNSTASGRPT